jgi:hypothetical protein
MIDPDVRGKRFGRKVVPSSADMTCFVDGRLARLEPLCSRSSSQLSASASRQAE